MRPSPETLLLFAARSHQRDIFTALDDSSQITICQKKWRCSFATSHQNLYIVILLRIACPVPPSLGSAELILTYLKWESRVSLGRSLHLRECSRSIWDHPLGQLSESYKSWSRVVSRRNGFLAEPSSGTILLSVPLVSLSSPRCVWDEGVTYLHTAPILMSSIWTLDDTFERSGLGEDSSWRTPAPLSLCFSLYVVRAVVGGGAVDLSALGELEEI